MQMVQIEQLIQGLFPYRNMCIKSLIFNMLNPISDNNKRIAKNTLLLYFRMQFLIGCIVVYEAMYIARMLK